MGWAVHISPPQGFGDIEITLVDSTFKQWEFFIGFFLVFKIFIDKNDDIGHASRGKMDDLKVAVY